MKGLNNNNNNNNNNNVGERSTLYHGFLIKASIQVDNSRKRIAVLLKVTGGR